MSRAYQALRAPRHEEQVVRGLRHRVTWWGERSENPVVLLHGFMDCGTTWQFLADCLPRGWSLAAPDWRGFGHTERATAGYWFPDYFADLECLLDQLAALALDSESGRFRACADEPAGCAAAVCAVAG